MATTPKEIAVQLGVDQRRVRAVLRDIYRPNGENKHARWVLDDEMVDAVRRVMQPNRHSGGAE